MRITNADGYDEPRDTISQDWSRYMTEAFPESGFLFIPNLGDKAIDYIKEWDINVLILTGGDDLGVHALRDETEIALLKYALDINMPILAICRGFQLVHAYFGGEILPGNDSFIKTHRATHHDVIFDNKPISVNSFHTNIIDETSIHRNINILARCTKDHSIEAYEINNILAMMWHPERDKTISRWNKELIENFILRINGTNKK